MHEINCWNGRHLSKSPKPPKRHVIKNGGGPKKSHKLLDGDQKIDFRNEGLKVHFM